MRPITTTRLLNAAAPPDLSDANVDDDAAVVRLDSSSMAVTALVILLALLFLGFFSVYARRLFFAGSFHRSGSSSYYSSDAGRRRSSGTPQQPPRRLRGSMFAPVCGLDPAALRALPVLRYVGGGAGGVKDQGGCVVCLGEFAEKERVKVIPRCGHAFHPACIDAWLASRGSCPICRCTEMFRSDLSPEANTFVAAAASIGLDLPDRDELVTGGEAGEQRGEEDVGVAPEGGGRRREDQKEENATASASAAALASAAEGGRRSRSDRWRRDEAEEEGRSRRVEDSAGMSLRRTCSI